MLLAIDTATRYASVAFYNSSGIVAEQSWYSPNNHSVEMMPAIVQMAERQGISPEDLTAVAVAKGPGSFTGLRIGMSLAKGLCLALGIPIIAIPTLDIITYAVGDPGCPVLAVLEAGRGRICVATYRFEEGLPAQVGEIELVKENEWVVDAKEPVLVAGEVSAELAERLSAQPNAENIAIASLAGSLRRAGYLAELAWERLQAGQTDDLDTLSPIYLHYPAPNKGPSDAS
ncbi:MAG: tRNA (adenosine(37)-N6)-threonylcarbamoyltransferase complex dimerization subunit type 1 TsaB [Anaerolineae bacterium]|nr:tRNA (adenosine(37)-N6)-threonylcarbamoyltransferase complex dimerization subunit type 1 TsaB [Anaerolineae bacterium]